MANISVSLFLFLFVLQQEKEGELKKELKSMKRTFQQMMEKEAARWLAVWIVSHLVCLPVRLLCRQTWLDSETLRQVQSDATSS